MTTGYPNGFISQEHEIRVDDLPVRGEFPAWLRGTLVRNGPAQFEVGAGRYRHWFDGLAMLHRFGIQDGRVSYANKFLQTDARDAAQTKGKISYREFATDPCRSVFQRALSLFSPLEPGYNTNVNIAKIADSFIAMTETPAPVEFDPETLATLGVFDYGDRLPGQITTAHPHHDFQRGETLNFTVHMGTKNHYHVYRIAAGSRQRQLIGSIPVKHVSYLHSFGMTENYFVLAEYPMALNLLALLTGSKTYAECLEWQAGKPARFLLISRRDGSLAAAAEAEPFFAFHHVNAYEEGDSVIVDISAYPDSALIRQLYLDNLRKPDNGPKLGELRRYRISLTGKRADHTVMSDEVIELPRIDYARRNGADYRYVYGISTNKATPTDFQNQLVKVDVRERATRCWYEANTYPGEPVFVRTPGSSAEDGGVLLSVVLDARAGKSFLLVLDAASLTEVARAEVPQHIPFGFHGQFFGQE